MPKVSDKHAVAAEQIVNGARQDAYGNPEDSFTGIAAMWSALLTKKLREPILASDVARMMVALKLRRDSNKPGDDNVVDAHGYLMLLTYCLEIERAAAGSSDRPATA